MNEESRFDVLEVEIETRQVRSILAEKKTARAAGAIEDMAVLRRGVDTSFFVTAPAGRYAVGDIRGEED